jgi:hypothetical protein
VQCDSYLRPTGAEDLLSEIEARLRERRFAVNGDDTVSR